MLEKRRNPRMNLTMELSISSLFKQDNDSIEIDSPITITDISKGGIGFTTDAFLPIGYYFNASIRMGRQDAKLYCVVKIVRSQMKEGSPDKYSYGCEFVGMAPVLDFLFDEYAEEINFDPENQA